MSESLPTNKVAYEKQKVAIKGFAKAGTGGKVATNKAVSEMLGIHDTAVRPAADFFASIGLLKEASGGYTIAKELNEYYIAEDLGEANAFYRLAPVFEKTWFAKSVLPKIQLRSISEQEAITAVGITSSYTGKEYIGRLKMLLLYMRDVGLIEIDGGRISLKSQSNKPEEDEMEHPKVLTVTESNVAKSQPIITQTPRNSYDNFTGIQLDFSIKVESSEISKWSPERITAFFSGLAQVMAAKATLDQQVKQE